MPRKPDEPSRREALAILLRFAAERVSPEAANGTLSVDRKDREAVETAFTRLFADAHGRQPTAADYAAHELDNDERAVSMPRTTLTLSARIGTFSLYTGTHSSGGGNGVTLTFHVLTWSPRFHPVRWYAELYLHNTLPADREHGLEPRRPDDNLRHPIGDHVQAAEMLLARMREVGHPDKGEAPATGVYAVGETEDQALQHLQSLLDRARRALRAPPS